MANYLQPNEYQTYQTSPYRLPTQQILQAIQTRNQYWDSAMSNVNSAYQNYLNLDLSRGDNHERLQGLMQGVNEDLKKVSKTDLSIGENYGKALGIFDPILKDDNIMGDNAITKHYKSQYQLGQSLRTKDGGKEYSDTNMRDLSNHLQDFVNDPDASNWRQHYSGRAFYTPYVDYSSAISKISKDFKPNTDTLSAPGTLDPATGRIVQNPKGDPYMLTISDRSILASQYRAFINAHLGEKEKNQIALEGRVKYHDSIDALASDYHDYNDEKMGHYNQEIARLTGLSTSATPTQQELYKSQIGSYQDEVDKLKVENTKIKAGDYSGITPYKNQIASQIYSDKYFDYLGRASAQKNLSIVYTPNKIWQTQVIQDNENKRFNIAKDVQLEIAREKNKTQLAIHGITLGANGLPTIDIYAPSDKSNDESFGIDRFNQLKDDNEKAFTDSKNELNRVISHETGVSVDDPGFEAATKGWFDRNPNNYAYKNYTEAAQLYNTNKAAYESLNKFVDDKIKKDNPEIYNARENVLNNIKTNETLKLAEYKGPNVTGWGPSADVSKTLTLSPQDIKDIINGNSTKGKLVTVSEAGQTGPGGVPHSVNNTLIEVNGTKYSIPYGTLNSTIAEVNRKSAEFEAKRADILNQNITRVIGKGKVFEDDKNPIYKAIHTDVIRTVGGENIGELKPENIMVTNKDNQGNIYFKIQKGANDNIDLDALKLKVGAAGGAYYKKDDEYMLPQKHFGQLSQPQSYNNPKLGAIRTLVDTRSMINPNDIFDTPDYSFGKRNFHFKVIIRGGQPAYQIIDSDPKSKAVFGVDASAAPFSTLDAAAAKAEQLGAYTDDVYAGQVIKLGNVPDYQP